MISVSSCEKTW